MQSESRSCMADGRPINTFVVMARRFLFYRVLSRFSFYVPILVVALVAFGYSFLSVGVILFAYGLSTLFFGGWARRLSERFGVTTAIAVGELLKGISNAAMALVLSGLVGEADETSTLVVVLAAQIVGGGGYALAATGDGSFLTRAAGLLGDASRERQAQAHSASAMFVSFLMAGVAGALMYRAHSWLPFVATAIANVVAGGWAAAMLRLPASANDSKSVEPPYGRRGAGVDVNRGDSMDEVRDAEAAEAKGQARMARHAGGDTVQQQASGPAADRRNREGGDSHVKDRPFLKKAQAWGDVLAYALIRAVVIVFQLFILPVWFFLGLKLDISLFGAIFAMYTLTGFLAGRAYPELASRLGEERARAALFSVTVFSLLLTGISGDSWLALVAPVGAFAGAGMVRPALLPRLSTVSSHTVSLAERLFGMLTAVLYLAGGVALESGITPSSLAFWSGVILLAGIGSLRVLQRIQGLSATSISEDHREAS